MARQEYRYGAVPAEDHHGHSAGEQPPSYEHATAEDMIGDEVFQIYKTDRFVAEGPIEVRMSFLRKVYGILSIQLFGTAIINVLAMTCKPYRAWILAHPGTIWAAFIAALGFMFLSYRKDNRWPVKIGYLTGFTAAMGYIASFATATTDTSTVVLALFMTLAVFFGLTLFAIVSRIDFSAWTPYLFAGLLVMVVAGLVSAFFPYSSVRELVFGIAGTVIFSGYVLVDTQRIMERMHLGDEVEGAMTLYLDVLNLFLSILRILNAEGSGSSRD